MPYSVTGTYVISSDSAGLVQLGSGTITLSGGSDVQSPNWSGTTPLVLNGNGSATLNGVGTSSWYSPNTANVGAGYYINITRTGGTTGVNFAVAQGSWTIITNTGRSIGMTGYTGDVGTVSVSGTYQISSSVTGTPVLGSGTIALSVNAGTVIHVYTSGTAATETIPTGTTNVSCEVWGSGGGGGGNNTGGHRGGNGGAGGFAYSVYTAAGLGGVGKTFRYTVPAGGAGGFGGGGNGGAGAAGTITALTVTGFTAMTANGGALGTGATPSANGAGGSGGTATGGNTTNTTGGTGTAVGTTGSISGDGSPYGGGGVGSNTGSGSAGSSGAVVFFYS
jgi:hypothetical protein